MDSTRDIQRPHVAFGHGTNDARFSSSLDLLKVLTNEKRSHHLEVALLLGGTAPAEAHVGVLQLERWSPCTQLGKCRGGSSESPNVVLPCCRRSSPTYAALAGTTSRMAWAACSPRKMRTLVMPWILQTGAQRLAKAAMVHSALPTK